MNDSTLSPRLLAFIRGTLPSYEAAVVLVFASREPDRLWTLDELAARIGGGAVSTRELEGFVGHFARTRLIEWVDRDHFRFAPGSDDHAEAVAELRDAYDHRPVTLIRVVRGTANAPLQSFSDSFRLKED